MNESKYIVFKREDFKETWGSLARANLVTLAPEIDDVVALRLQDKFTAPTMQAYFDAVCNAMEVLEEFGMPDENINIENLSEIRDWAFCIVQQARTHKGRKVPDF